MLSQTIDSEWEIDRSAFIVFEVHDVNIVMTLIKIKSYSLKVYIWWNTLMTSRNIILIRISYKNIIICFIFFATWSNGLMWGILKLKENGLFYGVNKMQ